MQDVGKRPRDVKALGFICEFSLCVDFRCFGENGAV